MAQGSSNLNLNLTKIANTTVSTSTGNTDAGTQRVVIASDQQSIPVTDNGGSLTVDGSVSVSNFPATQAVSIATLPALAAGTNTIGKVDVNGTVPVSGTFWQATQPVSGTVAISGTVPISGALTDTQLRASAVPVSGTFWQATQPVSIATLPALAAGTNNIGDVDVASLPGTVAADITAIKTATELLDNALGTDGGVVSTGMLRVGGTDGINNQTLSVNNLGHLNIADGGNSITVDGTFWQATQPVSLASVPSHPVTNAGTFAVQATQAGTWNISSITSLPALAAGTNNIGDVDVASLPGTVAADITAIKTATELLDNAYGASGSSSTLGMLRVGGTDGTNNRTFSVNSSGHLNIADGGNSITVDGTVGISGTVPVSGTFWQATQPVSGTVAATQSGTWNINSITSLPSIPAGNNNIGDVDVASLPGTVAADITAIKVATELLDNALGTDGSTIATTMLRVGGTDGTNNQTLSVNTAGHVNIADGGNSITVDGTVGISGTVPVSGTFWQATQPVSISSAVPVTDNGGSLTVDGSVSVSNFPATQAVSGTVAISGTVPISGALTDTQLRASAVAVSLASVPSHPVTNAGTFAVQATQAGTWNIGSITNLPALAAGTNNIGSVSLSPNALVANAPTNASTTAYAASLIVKATAGVLYIITGFNSRSSGQFIQIFDSATLPADTSVPKVIFYVESNSNFSFDLGAYGRAFSSGIVICNSSTGPTKKIGAADCWFDVQYK
jgi:ferritin-like protein